MYESRPVWVQVCAETLDILHPDSLLLPGPPARNATSMSATATGGGVNDILHATQIMPARARQPVITSLEATHLARLQPVSSYI